MKKILLLMAFWASLSYGNGCVLVQADDINVTWKAYKTFEKLGVAGSFTAVEYTPNKKEGKNFRELFVGSKVKIDPLKIDTHNAGRDKTLAEHFFAKLAGKAIEGEIVNIQADLAKEGKRVYHGRVDVNITMNSKQLTIPMHYNYHEGIFEATGTIDLFDFSVNKALSSINKSCFVLHKGKTWNDVTIGFRTTVKATLCDVKIKKQK